jgi:hypothetical protein
VEYVDSPATDPADQGGPEDAVPGITHVEHAGGFEQDGGSEPTGGFEQDGGSEPTGGSEQEDGKDPLRFNNWMKRSATGAVMTGIALGLQQALEPRKPEVPYVIEAREDPDDLDGPIDLRFDPDSPADTVAIIRRPVTDDGPPPASP